MKPKPEDYLIESIYLNALNQWRKVQSSRANLMKSKGKNYARHVKDGWGNHIRPHYDAE